MNLINISARCPYFEIEETVSEKEAPARLAKIRDMFEARKRRIAKVPAKGKLRHVYKWRLKENKDKLTVITTIANPKMFL